MSSTTTTSDDLNEQLVALDIANPKPRLKAKTNDGYNLKIYLETLHQCAKVAPFFIRKEGISVCTMDPSGHLLVDSILDNFLIYQYSEDFNVGIDVHHFYKTMKSVKKKDIVKLILTHDDKLVIIHIPKDGGKVVETELPVSTIQTWDFVRPDGYEDTTPIVVYSDQFQKMCKDLNSSKNISVKATKRSISFCVDHIYKINQEFSVYDADDYQDENVSMAEKKTVIYDATFSETNLTKFLKRITRTNPTFKIYAQAGAPLLFKIPIGNIGKLNIYVKSNEEIKQEAELEDEDEEGDYLSI